MKECKVVSVDLYKYDLEIKRRFSLDAVNNIIASWLAQGWQVLSVNPFVRTPTNVSQHDELLITFYR